MGLAIATALSNSQLRPRQYDGNRPPPMRNWLGEVVDRRVIADACEGERQRQWVNGYWCRKGRKWVKGHGSLAGYFAAQAKRRSEDASKRLVRKLKAQAAVPVPAVTVADFVKHGVNAALLTKDGHLRK
jgi:hypothetical protein